MLRARPAATCAAHVLASADSCETQQGLSHYARMGVAPRNWRTWHDDQPGEVDPVGGSLTLSVSLRALPGALGPGWLTAGATPARERAPGGTRPALR